MLGPQPLRDAGPCPDRALPARSACTARWRCFAAKHQPRRRPSGRCRGAWPTASCTCSRPGACGAPSAWASWLRLRSPPRCTCRWICTPCWRHRAGLRSRCWRSTCSWSGVLARDIRAPPLLSCPPPPQARCCEAPARARHAAIRHRHARSPLRSLRAHARLPSRMPPAPAPRCSADAARPQRARRIRFALEEVDIATLQGTHGSRRRSSSHALTQAYLDRIAAIDDAGPTLNAVIELNPDALKEADALRRRAQGRQVARPAARHPGAAEGQHRCDADGELGRLAGAGRRTDRSTMPSSSSACAPPAR